jgi:hypothetical protein
MIKESAATGRVSVRVIRTDEQWTIAKALYCSSSLSILPNLIP